MNERLLIDTCALLWLANKSDSLSLVASLTIAAHGADFVLTRRGRRVHGAGVAGRISEF